MKYLRAHLMIIVASSAVVHAQEEPSPFSSEAGMTLAIASLGEVTNREGIQAYITAVIDGWYASKMLNAMQELERRNAYTQENLEVFNDYFLACKKLIGPMQLLDLAVAEAYEQPQLPLAVYVHLQLEDRCSSTLAESD